MQNSVNMTKLLIGTVLGFIVIFGFGAVWHFMIFKSYYYSNPDLTIQRPDALLAYIIIGEALRAFVTAWLFLKIYQATGATMSDGLVFGLMVGVFAAALWGFINYGAMTLPMNWVLMDGSFGIVQGLLNGVLLALLNAKKKA